MAAWNITAADRDEAGNIKTQFATLLDETMAATGAAPAAEERPAPARQPLSRRQVVLLAGALLILVAALVALPAPPQSTPAARPTAAPAAAPSPLPTAPPPARQVTAYAAPGGDVLGPIPADAAPQARYGERWVQVPHDGGAVWIAAQDAPGTDLATLPDLAPRPTTAPAPIVAGQSPPTTEPQTCIRTDYGQRCGPASLMANEQAVANEIATESKERSDAWLATATAERAAREASHQQALRDLDATREAQP